MAKFNLFINYDGDIEDIAKEISELFEIELTKKIGEDSREKYIFRFFEIEFVLFGDHELEDDCGIVFSDYGYELSMIKLRSGEKYRAYDNLYENMAIFLTERLSYAFNTNVMLVDNLQSIILESAPVAS